METRDWQLMLQGIEVAIERMIHGADYYQNVGIYIAMLHLPSSPLPVCGIGRDLTMYTRPPTGAIDRDTIKLNNSIVIIIVITVSHQRCSAILT